MRWGHAFTYGSLMCANIIARVIGRAVAGEPAWLSDHRRLAVAGEDYPGLIEAIGHTVEGMLYRNLDAEAWRRLDLFEGEEYERVAVQVTLANGETIPAWVYRFRPQYHHRLLDRDWDWEAFLREGKARFYARYLGFARTDAMR